MKTTSTAAATTFLALVANASPAPQGPPASVTSNLASYASANGYPTATSDWSSLGSEFSSWTSEASVTAWPTASSQWASLTSAHPVPSGLSSIASSFATLTTAPAGGWGPGAFGGPGGFGGPGRNGSGSPGWNGAGGHGPFGGAGNGWGPWASESNSAWTNGPWTSWWGTQGCPASTWSGKLHLLPHIKSRALY